MAFPSKYLHEGEEIVLDRHPHAITLFGPAFALVVAGVVGAVASVLVKNRSDSVRKIAIGVPLVIMVAAALWLLKRWTVRRTTNFVVTTDRLIYRSGVLGKHGKEIPLERINDISYKQSIWERLIRTGDLQIESGGEQGQERFANVSNPYDVQNKIYAQIERTKARDMDRMAGRRELSAAEQIEKLHDLQQKGILTLAEFEAKKQQLLGLDPASAETVGKAIHEATNE